MKYEFPYQDPDHELNGENYRSGRKCLGFPDGADCNNPAGAAWSPYWCQECNTRRMDHISNQLNAMLERWA